MNPFSLVLFFYLLDPQVVTLVDKMGDNKQCVREAAYRRLLKMDDRSAPMLFLARHHHKEAEVRLRSRRLLNIYFMSAKTDKLGGNFPWIDCLPQSWPDREHVILGLYEEFGHPDNSPEPGPDPIHLRDATKSFARKLMEKGWRRGDVVRLLDDMVDNEKQWMEEGGGRHCYPPIFKK